MVPFRADASPVRVDLPVTPARPVVGLVVGPDGQPLAGVQARGLTALGDTEAVDGYFTVTGIDPLHGREVVFHHPGRGLGKLVRLRGDEAGPVVYLDASSTVMGRVVTARGLPVAGAAVTLRPTKAGQPVRLATDRDGRFAGGVAAGEKYTLHLGGDRRLRTAADDIRTTPGQCLDVGDLVVAE